MPGSWYILIISSVVVSKSSCHVPIQKKNSKPVRPVIAIPPPRAPKGLLYVHHRQRLVLLLLPGRLRVARRLRRILLGSRGRRLRGGAILGDACGATRHPSLHPAADVPLGMERLKDGMLEVDPCHMVPNTIWEGTSQIIPKHFLRRNLDP